METGNKTKPIFSLENNRNWWYQVRLYIVSHRQLQIKVSNDIIQETRYINFTGVEFYDGALSWTGGLFAKADRVDCLKVLRQIETYDKYDDAELEDFALYIAETGKGHVIRILANGESSLTKENLFANYVP